MSISSDFHSHVVRSSALRMAEAAQARGLRILGLSEHIFQMEEARPTLAHMHLEGPLLPFATYIEQVRQAGEVTGVEIRLGLEVDFIPGKNETIQEFLQGYPWDFLIGSIHEIDGVPFEMGKKLSRSEGVVLWSRYFALLRAAVQSGYFSLVSHPVRMRSQNPFLPANFSEELDSLAEEAAQCDVALEINGYDVLRYPSLVARLAQACANHRTHVSVGSDAHTPDQVAQAHTQSERILREVGITNVCIWRQGVREEYAIEGSAYL